jgi:hypothetical protein
LTFQDSFLVSGYEFFNLSKQSFCPRYQKKNEIIEENDLIFSNLDNLGEFLDNPPKVKVRLITHNSDSKFTLDHLNKVKNFVNKVYPINCILSEKEYPLIKKIPLGFVDNPYKPHKFFQEIKEEKNQKNIFVYQNFSINTNVSERTKCSEFFENKKWVLKEQNLSPVEFYRQLSKSQYSLSPQGTGIDCHRIYESIFLDCVPILKTSPLNDLYEKLPALIVEDWNELTEDFLKEKYEILFSSLKQWKEINKNWYKAEFWL